MPRGNVEYKIAVFMYIHGACDDWNKLKCSIKQEKAN